MNTVYLDSPMSDEARRQRIYQGQLFVFSPRPSTKALTEFARELIEEAFAPLDPRKAQYSLSVEEFVEIAAPLKPRFIHHPKTQELLLNVLEDFGCDMNQTYFDVPRMRIATSNNYLNAGVAYPLHPHRDSWYASPLSQLNWWLPVYEIESESSFAFHPHYWDKPIKNGSHDYNHYEWNRTGRKDAAKHIKADTRKQPKAEEPVNLDPQVRLVCPPGGLILFSGAQFHTTVTNTTGLTRFSVDFRTANINEFSVKGGAPNMDSEPTGTTLFELRRASDLAPVPQEIVALYDSSARPNDANVTFRPAEEVGAGRA